MQKKYTFAKNLIGGKMNTNHHNFSDSIQSEQKNHKRADDFYLNYLQVTDIVRYNRNTEADMKMQRSDIDVSFCRKGKYVKISEKFRAKDFGDLYVEFYSKFPDVRGWLDKSKADYIAYFFPARIFIIDEKALSAFYKNCLSNAISEDIFKRLIEQNPNGNAQKPALIKILDNSYKIQIIQAYNQTEDASWYTMGIAVPFKILADFDIYCKEFGF
ncbi:MAG: hypothetical protein LBP85_05880 [Prevotellaceae bacterium]|jgi:hypothetical protein|nr:hypothetical protein [Prevotellaceae bacterium]